LGWIIFGLVWGMAVFGIIFKAIYGPKYDLVSTILYVIMGWTMLIAAKTLYLNLSAGGLFLLIAGGLFYTGGVYFYIKGDYTKWLHGVWHFFVAGGSICHYFAILLYIVPK
jgi:hemolysin III